MSQGALNMTEAGKYLGVSRWFIQSLVRKGEIPYIRLGVKRKLISIRALDEWIKRMEAEPK